MSDPLREALVKRVGISYSIIRDIKCELDKLKKELSQIDEGLRIQKEEPKALTYEKEKDFVNQWLGFSNGERKRSWNPKEDRDVWPQIFEKLKESNLKEEFIKKLMSNLNTHPKTVVQHYESSFTLLETETHMLWKTLVEELRGE